MLFKYLKLFEYFEGDEPFRVIKADDKTYLHKDFILIEDYTLGEKIIDFLKKRLGDNFTIIKNEDTIFVCSSLKPFLWKILLLEDDYFFVKRLFLLENNSSTEMYFECDGIRGLIKLIDPSNTFHTLYEQSDMKIWSEDKSVSDNVKGSNWIDIGSFLSPTMGGARDIEKINYSLRKESYPLNKVRSMLDTLKKEIKLKVSKVTLYDIPENTIGLGISDSGYKIFKISSDDYKDFGIFYYYIEAFNMFCVLSVHFGKYVKTYRCWDIKGLKSLLSSI